MTDIDSGFLALHMTESTRKGEDRQMQTEQTRSALGLGSFLSLRAIHGLRSKLRAAALGGSRHDL